MHARPRAQMSGEDDWELPAKKRLRPSSKGSDSQQGIPSDGERDHGHHAYSPDVGRDKSITIASTARLASQTVAPFLTRHVPGQYNPLGQGHNSAAKDPNTKFCYRHRPDMLCRRQADEPSMDKLQRSLETLSQGDQQGIAQVWSLFSAAPSKHRQLMLQGILAQCCFPQLSYLSTSIRELIRIDFLSALPAEVSFRILCYLDTTSLCKAARVSRRWRQLADDDVVWHRMCEQHIDRKCTKCGWGLPLLERKRLRESKRQIQLRATGHGLEAGARLSVETAEVEVGAAEAASPGIRSDIEKASDGRLSPVASRRPPPGSPDSEFLRKTRPWKEVYKDRFKVGTNWKYGRYSTQIFKGHENGVMALQFYDNILATGSYDTTIRIWNIDTGAEMQVLRGHTMPVRCLQFDDTKLISGSLDKTVRVWNWRTGECISSYSGHAEGVISVHFDSNLLVSGSIDKTAKVWNFEDQSTFTLRGHTDWVNSVKIDSASRTIFTASDDLTVKLWDLDTRRCIRTYEGHVGQVQQVLLLPPEFEADEDGDAGDQSDHTEEAESEGDDAGDPLGSRLLSPVPNLAARYGESAASFYAHFPPSRPRPPRYMLTSGLDSTIRLWEVSTGRCLRTFFGHLEGVWAIAADTLRIVSGAEDRMVKVWDPRTGKCERTFTGHRGGVTCIGLSDSRICSGGEDGEVRMYSFF